MRNFTLLSFLLLFTGSSFAQGLITLTLSATTDTTNVLQIAEGQSATCKSWVDTRYFALGLPCSQLDVVKDGTTLPLSPVYLDDTQTRHTEQLVIAGPAVLKFHGGGIVPYVSMLTLDIQPSQYPPDQCPQISRRLVTSSVVKSSITSPNNHLTSGPNNAFVPK